MDQLFIPKKINVGFQNRSDTYTQKLAYVIYYDLKGVLRKEKSWNSWRDHKIPNVEFANDPTEGFVLNKGVGGGRSSWNRRNEYIRVYDPRDFEFEISVANLLFILRECDCSRGKGTDRTPPFPEDSHLALPFFWLQAKFATGFCPAGPVFTGFFRVQERATAKPGQWKSAA